MKYCIILLFFIKSLGVQAQTANVTTHDYQEISASKHYIIAVKYPQVDFGPDALMGVRGIAQDINLCVDTLRENLIKDFKNEIGSIPHDAPCAEQTSALNTEYKTVFNNGELFSFRFETNSGPGCANHPYTFATTLNYSTTGSGAFSFSDIFIKEKPYVKFISDYCITELKERAKKDGLENVNENIEQGACPDVYNFRVFNVTKNELVITFNPYWVGPWIWGIQSVTIPLEKIKEMINPAGPLGTLVK